ncbi:MULTISPECIES: DUF4177 domain-containing protein [unclassified Bacillus (in: firmicutes)]|uniref:DUF4177 domain-containing protein n=1 Tax=unclassified Bacillus (in: firmicutes) TaxID=185979 RepID=UPI00041329FF|nr:MULTISPECIES: DUF4177 domain-containing protein [unclassified Bacillus (in: firmicutes)]QHZ47045.1 DUF4177 domain-containing protein [Bacillus sp. NSP9.1]WFA07129.1 DUF4177 domain-containing protein [Bacillus sp. HSf4]
MKEYQFVKIELSSFNKKPKEDYREVIREYAREGWRFVQIFAPATSGYGIASYFELIFERDA